MKTQGPTEAPKMMSLPQTMAFRKPHVKLLGFPPLLELIGYSKNQTLEFFNNYLAFIHSSVHPIYAYLYHQILDGKPNPTTKRNQGPNKISVSPSYTPTAELQ